MKASGAVTAVSLYARMQSCQLASRQSSRCKRRGVGRNGSATTNHHRAVSELPARALHPRSVRLADLSTVSQEIICCSLRSRDRFAWIKYLLSNAGRGEGGGQQVAQ